MRQATFVAAAQDVTEVGLGINGFLCKSLDLNTDISEYVEQIKAQ